MVLGLLVTACTVGSGENTPGPESSRTGPAPLGGAGRPSTAAEDPSPPAPAPRAVPDGRAAAATSAVDALGAANPGTVLGVAVLDRNTGELATGASAGVPMYSASLVKVIVAVDVLDRRRTGLPVDDGDLALIRRALGPSDDDAMNALWTSFDGIGAIGRVAAALGLQDSRAPDDPSQWGESIVSARDMVTVYSHVLDGMPPADRDLLLGAMAAAPPVAADGFDQAYGLLSAGPRPDVAAKQGWLCCLGGMITLHSTGALDGAGQPSRYVVALLSSQPRGVGYDGARSTVTAASDAARAPLG